MSYFWNVVKSCIKIQFSPRFGMLYLCAYGHGDFNVCGLCCGTRYNWLYCNNDNNNKISDYVTFWKYYLSLDGQKVCATFEVYGDDYE